MYAFCSVHSVTLFCIFSLSVFLLLSLSRLWITFKTLPFPPQLPSFSLLINLECHPAWISFGDKLFFCRIKPQCQILYICKRTTTYIWRNNVFILKEELKWMRARFHSSTPLLHRQAMNVSPNSRMFYNIKLRFCLFYW